MKVRPYQLIVLLLAISLLGLLLLQGFWMQRFYVQKQDEFNKLVYSVLIRTANKLNERENIHVIKHSVLLDSSSHKNTFSRSVVIASASSVQVASIPEAPEIGNFPELPESDTLVWEDELSFTDSMGGEIKNQRNVIIKNRDAAWKMRNEELKKLMEKMREEISITESSYINRIPEPQLKALLNKEFEQAGIKSDFEFSLWHEDESTQKILTQSSKFDSTATYFKSDLSLGRVFNTNNYLLLQFPHQSSIIFSGIKQMLFLSLFFSLIIVMVFYYCIRLILKQKKLGEIKNDFINNMTHELKTPIATISLATDALAHPEIRQNEDKFNDYTRILKEENQKLNKHVEQVLQMALIDRGELQLNKTKLNLKELIQQSIKAHHLLIKNSRAEVRLKDPETPLYLSGDKHHLEHVINNLLDNALKYTQGTPYVEFSCLVAAGEISLKVRDNGIGIDADKKEKVFGKFYRAQGGNLHDVKGFGLGLSYVKSIMVAHQGSIEVESEKGKGSTFLLKFKSDA